MNKSSLHAQTPLIKSEPLSQKLGRSVWLKMESAQPIGSFKLRGYDEKHPREKTVRAWRIFCSNRKQATGCGRTFSVWMADKIKRLLLTADALWTFLKQAIVTGNELQAFQNLDSGLSDSAPYRIWKRFGEAHSAIRSALRGLCESPEVDSEQPAELTLVHLEAAFADPPCPIAAFQVRLQTFFM